MVNVLIFSEVRLSTDLHDPRHMAVEARVTFNSKAYKHQCTFLEKTHEWLAVIKQSS